jgi:hypothetical protein
MLTRSWFPVLSLLLVVSSSDAWVTTTQHATLSPKVNARPSPTTASTSAVTPPRTIPRGLLLLLFAGTPRGATGATSTTSGFGSSSAEKKEIKLKPKQQWDRYTTLKKEPSVKVAVKVVGVAAVDDTAASSSDWLDVGAVRTSPGTSIDIAVARQRALIAEVRWCLRG